MTKRRVVITGIGAITPYGVGADKLWEALKAGKSAISKIERIPLDGQSVHIAGEIKNFEEMNLVDPKEAKRLDRYNQFALVAAEEAVAEEAPVEEAAPVEEPAAEEVATEADFAE